MGGRQQSNRRADDREGGREEEGSGQSELACRARRDRGAPSLLTPITSEGHGEGAGLRR